MEILGKRVGSHTECGEDTSYEKGASSLVDWRRRDETVVKVIDAKGEA